MSGQIKRIQDIHDGRDAAQFARDRGYKVTKVGSYNRVDGPRGSVHIADCGRTMPKQERTWLIDMFIKIGIVALILGGCIGIYRLAEAISAAMGM